MQSGSVVVYLGLAVVLLCSGTFTQARYAGERSAIARLLTRLLDSEKRELPSPSRDVEDSSLLQILSDVSKKTYDDECRAYCYAKDKDIVGIFGSVDACLTSNGCADSDKRELPSPSRDVEDSSLLQILSDVSKKSYTADECRAYCENPKNAEQFESEYECMSALGCEMTDEQGCSECEEQDNINLFGSEDGCRQAMGC